MISSFHETDYVFHNRNKFQNKMKSKFKKNDRDEIICHTKT